MRHDTGPSNIFVKTAPAQSAASAHHLEQLFILRHDELGVAFDDIKLISFVTECLAQRGDVASALP